MTDQAKPLSFHIDRLSAITRDLWAANNIDLHMCDGTVRKGQFGLLHDIREDIAMLRLALNKADA